MNSKRRSTEGWTEGDTMKTKGTSNELVIEAIPEKLSVCNVTDYAGIDIDQPFVFTGRTDEEKSLVCPTRLAPAETVIPEVQVAVYSRCLIVRKGADGKLVSLQEGDLDAARRYMANMAQGESR